MARRDPDDFLDSLRYDLASNEVFVFTPKGDVVALPGGSTPVDFAYAVHTEVGHRTIGARVNGRLVPLESALENGDVVEVFTSKNPDAGPSQDWLTFVKSTRARSKIRGWFTKERREEAIEQGKELLVKAVRKRNLPLNQLLSADKLTQISQTLHLNDIDTLYVALGEGRISAQSVLEKIMALAHDHDDETFIVPTSKPTTLKLNDSGVLVKGASDILVKLAKCCTPVPGDGIIGFVTRGSGVSIHRSDCPNVASFESEKERFIEVEWAPSNKSVFRVHIQVEALDRGGLLSDITRVLSEHHVNILSASVATDVNRLATSRFLFEMSDTVHLDRLLNAVRRIEAVYDVYRVKAG